MLKIGDKPTSFVLPIYDGFGATLDFSEAAFSNKLTLLSFVDIDIFNTDVNKSWTWLSHMQNIRASLGTTVDYIAVIYNAEGNLTDANITTKIASYPVDLTGITVVRDNTWLSSFAKAYSDGFLPANDNSFTGSGVADTWSYIVSESFYITDKWYKNGSANNEPISFNRFFAAAPYDAVAFNSQDFANTEAYVNKRLTNLLASPTILSATPVESSIINTLPKVELVFSKPPGNLIATPPDEILLDITPVKDTANYSFTGGGATTPATLAFSGVNPILYENNGLRSVSTENVGKIENAVTLNLIGSLTEANTDVIVNVVLNNLIKDTAGNLLTKDTVTYTADLGGATLISVLISSNNIPPAYARTGNIITVTFESDQDIQTPTVAIAGQTATVSGGPRLWTASYTMLSTDTEGDVSFLIGNIKDLSNNTSPDVSVTTNASSVTFYKSPPAIANAVLQPDNSFITLTFNRPVYSASGASGALTTGDFSINLNTNGGNTTNASISAITHIAGQTTVQAQLSLSPLPKGVETVEILPVAGQVFDAAGNTAQTVNPVGPLTLNDAIAPVLTAVTVSSNNLASAYAKTGDQISLSFQSNENIQTPTVTIAGQTAAVGGGPQAWTAAYIMQSTDTEGAVPFEISSIQDTLGNPATNVNATTDTSEVTFLKTIPAITNTVLATDNSFITLTFNRPVYSDPGALGSLVTTDFNLIFSQNGGAATAAVITSVDHIAGNNTAQVNINVTPGANGQETIEIKPVLGQIFDAASNEVAPLNPAGAINLNDFIGPVLNTVSIASTNPAPGYAKTGDTVNVTIIANEDLQTPSVTVEGKPATVTGGPKTWTASYAVQAADPQGQIPFVISALKDVSGNPSPNVSVTTDASAVTLLQPSPVLVNQVLEADNSFITVVFDRAVYSNIGATGNLNAADFTLNFNANGGSATAASITSVEHIAGETAVKINLSISPSPNGLETIEIIPAANQIFDAAGNPAQASNPLGAVNLQNFAPDIFVRDSIQDTGSVPAIGGVSQSPDIILLNNAPNVATLQADYGGTDPQIVNNLSLSRNAEFGQKNYVIIRARNIGSGLARNAYATIYYGKFATSILPSAWVKLGTVTFPTDIPNDGALYVSNPLVWPADNVPGIGHYCLITTIGCDGDPEPTWAEITSRVTSVQTYIQYIKDVNEITYRNMNVVDLIKAPAPPVGIMAGGKAPAQKGPEPAETPDGHDPYGFHPLSFAFSGGTKQDQGKPMDLEIKMNFPEKSRALLEIPAEYTNELLYSNDSGKEKNYGKAKIIKTDQKRKTVLLFLNPHRLNYFTNLYIPALVRPQFRLFVRIPEEYTNNHYLAYAAQLAGGEELGRVSWQIGSSWGSQPKPPVLFRLFHRIARVFGGKRIFNRYSDKY